MFAPPPHPYSLLTYSVVAAQKYRTQVARAHSEMFRLVTEVIFVLQPALELEPDAEDGGGEGQDRRRGQGQAARRDRGQEEEAGAGE